MGWGGGKKEGKEMRRRGKKRYELLNPPDHIRLAPLLCQLGSVLLRRSSSRVDDSKGGGSFRLPESAKKKWKEKQHDASVLTRMQRNGKG